MPSLLVYKNITTYDFIVMEQKRVRDKAKAKAEARTRPAATEPPVMPVSVDMCGWGYVFASDVSIHVACRVMWRWPLLGEDLERLETNSMSMWTRQSTHRGMRKPHRTEQDNTQLYPRHLPHVTRRSIAEIALSYRHLPYLRVDKSPNVQTK